MEEGEKNRFIAILILIGIIFFVLWLSAKTELSRQKNVTANKAALSMELEEKNVKLEKEKAALEIELKNSRAHQEEEKDSLEAVKKTLSQEQIAQAALKGELERVTLLKDRLENDLKEALVAQKK